MTRFLLALALALTLGFALAQEAIAPHDMARVMAFKLDATMMETCPDVALAPDASCFTYLLDQDWLKLQLDGLMRELNDLVWTSPWMSKDAAIGRSFRHTADYGDKYIVMLIAWGDGSLAIVQTLDPEGATP